MNSLLEYLFTSSWLLGLLVLGFNIFLQNQKLLRFNRYFLLGTLLLSLLHPLLSAAGNLLPLNLLTTNTLPLTQAEQYLPELVLSPQQAANPFPVSSLLTGIYLTGCVIALLLFLLRLLELRKMLHQLTFKATPDGLLLAQAEGSQPTFSFFRYLVINKAHAATAEEYRLVLAHEKVHARQLHSADVLLAELVQVLLWFHPAIYLLNKALRQTHEHLADAAVIKASGAETTYIALMAKEGLAAAGLPLSSTFFQSFTINRIRMIRKNTPAMGPWRVAASLLLTVSLTAFIACEDQEQSSQSPPSDAAGVYEMPPPPPPVEKTGESEIATATPDDSGVYEIVEEEALPQDGMHVFYQQLMNNIKYPQEALTNNVEGTTYIRFIVDEQGNVATAEAIPNRLVGYGLDEEAVRVIKATKWTPAKHNGNAVKQRKILPVKFKLKETSEQESTKKPTSQLFQGMLKTPEKDLC